MAYLAYTDVERFLGITLNINGRNAVNDIIAGLEPFVDTECNRTWTKDANTNIDETFDGGQAYYFVKTPPIASVVSLTVDDFALTEGTDFYIYDDHVLIPSTASRGFRNVDLRYKTSANSLPVDLKHALVRWVSEVFKTQEHGGKSVSKFTAGAVTFEYLTQDGIPAFVEKVLDKYRIIAL